MTPPEPALARRRSGTVREVFAAFGVLGLTSFGGPVAHLGYFREAFVERRRWMTDRAYADLVALCQFLPGPASSQVGMAIGLQRAGLFGMLAAWLAFTLPSAIVLVAAAYGLEAIGFDSDAGWLLGLKAAAVAVVAHALLGMARTLTPDVPRATIGVAAAVAALVLPHVWAQVAIIVAAGVAGLAWNAISTRRGAGADSGQGANPATTTDTAAHRFAAPRVRHAGVLALVTFVLLLIILPVLVRSTNHDVLRLVDVFYRAGALVFGGGHVVLPLLESGTVGAGLVERDFFLAGYGAAQAVPGPLFTFAAFLGAGTTSGPSGFLGATIALFAIFLPSALLVAGALPFWERVRTAPRIRTAIDGVNAGVVGILGAALYTPVFTAGVLGPATMSVAAVAFVALTTWSTPAWAVVIGSGLVGLVLL